MSAFKLASFKVKYPELKNEVSKANLNANNVSHFYIGSMAMQITLVRKFWQRQSDYTKKHKIWRQAILDKQFTIPGIKWFSKECCKIKTKVIILTNHNRLKQQNEPINQSQVQENMQASHDWFGFGSPLVEGTNFANQSQRAVMQNHLKQTWNCL